MVLYCDLLSLFRKTNSVISSFALITINVTGMYHPSHRGRSRGDREREYDEYSASMPPRDMYHHHQPSSHHHYAPHHGSPRDMYRAEPADEKWREHPHPRRDPDHDYHSPHRASSRRTLNAI